MKLAIMQPYFLPYIGYFQLLNAVDRFVIYDDVNYIKGGWINRNRILVNDDSHLISIPLIKASPYKKINEHLVSPNATWKRKMIDTIRFSYKKAPHYKDIFPFYEQLINYEAESLVDYLYHSISTIAARLGINTPIVRSSEIYKNSHLNGQARVIDICRKEKCNLYINPIGGEVLYSKRDFEESGLILKFHKSKEISYPQFGTKHIPFLSIVDVMMFNGSDEMPELLEAYDLM